MPDIMHLLRIKSAPQQTFEAVSTPEGIRRWWTSDADLARTVGGFGEFRFHGRTGVTRVAVDELVESRRLSWVVVSSFLPGWGGTRIAFDLQPENGGTALRFRHAGFPQHDDSYALTTTGWAYYLVSLQQYLERGEGAPHPQVDFAQMIR